MMIFVDCSTPLLALVVLIFFGIFAGGMVAGAFTASLCITPDLSGTIESSSGFMAILAIIFSPLTSGFINQTGSRAEWNIVFGITGGLLLFSGAFFLIFGSAEIQPWSKFSSAHLHPPQIYAIEAKVKHSDEKQNSEENKDKYNERLVL